METENNNSTDPFLQDLSEDEQNLLLKIQNKIQQKLNEARASKYDNVGDGPLDFSEKHPDVIPPVHIGKNPHEIRITVEIDVSEVDEKGYLKETKQVSQKHYHIPIPSTKNYNEYLDKFTETFHNKLTESCRAVFSKKEYDE